MREDLGSATQKNPPVYGDRHVSKVKSGTRETLPRTAWDAVESEPISPKGEVASCGKGVGGGHSTEEARQHNLVEGRASQDNTPLRSWAYEEVRASECRNPC
jgi:hypothetical protein